MDRKTRVAAYVGIADFIRCHQVKSVRKNDWSLLSSCLEKAGVEKRTVLACLSWTAQILLDNRTVAQIRILHDMERDLIDPAAYGALLEALQLGLIESNQTEGLLEEIASRDILPISVDTMKAFLARTLFRNLSENGGAVVH